MERPRSIFGPLLLIAAGIVWLLVKAGTIPSENLWALTHIWPFLLIAAGLGLILRPFWRYSSVLLDILVIGGTILAILYAPQLGWANPSMVYAWGDGDFFAGPTEPGSGKVVTQTRNVSSFDSIEIDYPAQVVVSQGDAVLVQVEADDNVLPGLKTQVRGDTLEIFYRAEDGIYVRPSKPVMITLVVRDLRDVNFDGAGEFTINGLETDELNISASGAGSLELNEIAVNSLSVDLSGAGNVTASGEADSLDLTISGVGKFDGKDLHSQTASASLSGVGSATVWVDDELEAEISGAGSVNYFGSADVTRQVSGIGGVNHIGDK